jgi:hypothetical protein
MTPDRIAARLDQQDRDNLATLAAALATTGKEAGRAPWEPQVTLTGCLKVALKFAAEAARAGNLPRA